jgi:hypothetical protein
MQNSFPAILAVAAGALAGQPDQDAQYEARPRIVRELQDPLQFRW